MGIESADKTRMALEDRIRSSVDAALVELTARVDTDVRAMVQQLIDTALIERDEAVSSARQAAAEAAAADTRRQVEAAEAQARVREREAEMAGVSRLVDSVRQLDAAATLSDVLDALAQAAAREVARAALLVIRGDRLIGWKLSGFGARDSQPRAIDIALTETGVTSLAATTARPVSTRDAGASIPAFAQLPGEHLGFAVPVSVGGRAVAIIYADTGMHDRPDHYTPSGWPEVIEVLARHAARCLEALTAQKAVSAATPRFWMQAASRPGMGA